MLNVIKDSYILFFKKLPLWVALLLPLVAFSYADEYVRATHVNSWFMRLGGVVVVTIVELLVFKFVAEIKFGNVWQIVKRTILISLYHMILGIIVIIPVYVFMHIAAHHNILTNWFLFFTFVVNIFLSGYVLAKYNTLLPLMAKGEKMSLSLIKQHTKGSYKDWCVVSSLLYFPYVCSLFLINCTLTSIVVSSLFVIVFSIFNALYYNLKK